MSRPKMVSVLGGGGGGLGPSHSGAYLPTGCGSASGALQDSGRRPEPAARLAGTRVSRGHLRIGAGAGCALRRGEGDRVRVGYDLAAALRVSGTAPSRVSTPLVPLPTAGEPWPPRRSAADPRGPGLAKALP